jgi:hypothetical protein
MLEIEESALPERLGGVPAGFLSKEISPFIRHFSSQVKKCLLIVRYQVRNLRQARAGIPALSPATSPSHDDWPEDTTTS